MSTDSAVPSGPETVVTPAGDPPTVGSAVGSGPGGAPAPVFRLSRRSDEWRRLRQRVIASQDGCAICGKKWANVQRISIDHVLPRCLGGDDDRENLQAVCPSCNSRKSMASDRRRLNRFARAWAVASGYRARNDSARRIVRHMREVGILPRPS